MKINRRNRKPKKKSINAGMFLKGLMDFENFTVPDNDTVFKVKIEGTEKYISILSVAGIDIFHYTNDDMESVFNNFAKATIAMKLPHKYVFTNQTPYFGQQKEFLKYKINKTSHPYTEALLQKKYDELNTFESDHKDRLAYLIVFSDKIEELTYCCTKFKRAMLDTDVKFCYADEAIAVFNKYLCYGEESAKIADYRQINDIVLPSSLKFAQNYCKVDDMYVTSLVVNDYPAYLLDLELANLVSAYDDCTITLDVKFRPKNDVIGEIKQSLKELDSRKVIKQDVSDDIDTQNEFEKLTAIYNDITSGNEQMVYTTLRFFIADIDLDNLKKRVRDLSEELESKGISTFTPINEMKKEYFGLVKEDNSTQIPYPLQDTFKRQYPFYYQSHTDPSGMFFGFTDTYGLNIFNPFYRNGRNGRNSYDLLAFGVKGSGKSVMLKSMLQDQIILGNKAMVLDIESEYGPMARIFDGQVIKMNRRSTINPLQMRITIDVDAENSDMDDSEKLDYEDALAANYASEISRICTFMYQYNPSVSDEEMSVFRDVLVEVYRQKGIIETTDISALAPQQFPVFGDVLSYIKEQQKYPLSEFERTLYIKLETMVKQLCKGGAYGTMFDNYTNVEIDERNLIIFDVKTLSEMDSNVYNAQLFNILSLMWAEICKNLTLNKHIVNPYDRRNIVCLIDEAHRFISTKYVQVTEFIEKLLRRSRKYDAGLWFASQSILDFLPSGNTEQAEKIKVIFQLVQYKIILKQPSGSLELLKDIFNQFTLSELKTTTSFVAGEMLMSISSGRHKIHCHRQVSDCELMYIGNAQDRSEIIHRIFRELYNEYSSKEYGKLLIDGGTVQIKKFIDIFTKEIYERFGFQTTVSDYLYSILNTVVTNLCEELIQTAKES